MGDRWRLEITELGEAMLYLGEGTPAGVPLRYSREIQGNVLAAFNKDHQKFRFVHFNDTTSARTWLTAMLGHVSVTADVEQFNAQFSLVRRVQGADPTHLKATWVGLSLTPQGLRVLVGDTRGQNVENDLKACDPFVVEGAKKRAAELGDDDPAQWLFGGKQEDITVPGGSEVVHAVVIVAADDKEDLDEKLKTLAVIDKDRVVMVQDLLGETLPGELKGHEHFGFKDGISQPGVEMFHESDPNRPGQRLGHPGTVLISPVTSFSDTRPSSRAGSSRGGSRRSRHGSKTAPSRSSVGWPRMSPGFGRQ